MLDTAGVGVRWPVLRVDRVEHLGGRLVLADIGVVAGHGGGGVGDELIGGFARLVGTVVWSKAFIFAIVFGVVVVVAVVGADAGCTEGSGYLPCCPRNADHAWREHSQLESTRGILVRSSLVLVKNQCSAQSTLCIVQRRRWRTRKH